MKLLAFVIVVGMCILAVIYEEQYVSVEIDYSNGTVRQSWIKIQRHRETSTDLREALEDEYYITLVVRTFFFSV